MTNEKYVGNNIYNRMSFKLKKKRVLNPPEMWIRSDAVFESIVPAELFTSAQTIIRERSRKYSNDELRADWNRVALERQPDDGCLQAIGNLASGKSAFGVKGLYGKNEQKDKIKRVLITGNPPKTEHEWQYVLQYVNLQRRLRELAYKWNSLATELGLTTLGGTTPMQAMRWGECDAPHRPNNPNMLWLFCEKLASRAQGGVTGNLTQICDTRCEYLSRHSYRKVIAGST